MMLYINLIGVFLRVRYNWVWLYVSLCFCLPFCVNCFDWLLFCYGVFASVTSASRLAHTRATPE